LPSCGSSTITSGFSAISVRSAASWAAASTPASTVLNVTSSNDSACALALLVIAAIQPWSAAGAEKPIVTSLPAWAFALSPSPLICASFGSASLLVHAVSSAPAPSAAPPNSSRRRLVEWVMTTS
jgi:hypothetical protein